MQWSWDERKARANIVKHGVLFETAALIFEDAHCISAPDPHSDDDRWRTIGMAGSMTLFVIHTVMEPDGSGRIISARRATPRERRLYERLRF
jgi:uncharacterized DUF497 family protein